MAVVDAPYPAVATQQAVARLPVGVVGQHVEYGQGQQVLTSIADQIEVGDIRVALHVCLHRPDAVRPFPDKGDGDIRPAQRPAQQVRGVLPLVQGAEREVVKGPLAVPGLVDRPDVPARARVQVHKKRVVRAPGNALTADDLALPEKGKRLRWG